MSASAECAVDGFVFEDRVAIAVKKFGLLTRVEILPLDQGRVAVRFISRPATAEKGELGLQKYFFEIQTRNYAKKFCALLLIEFDIALSSFHVSDAVVEVEQNGVFLECETPSFLDMHSKKIERYTEEDSHGKIKRRIESSLRLVLSSHVDLYEMFQSEASVEKFIKLYDFALSFTMRGDYEEVDKMIRDDFPKTSMVFNEQTQRKETIYTSLMKRMENFDGGGLKQLISDIDQYVDDFYTSVRDVVCRIYVL